MVKACLGLPGPGNTTYSTTDSRARMLGYRAPASCATLSGHLHPMAMPSLTWQKDHHACMPLEST